MVNLPLNIPNILSLYRLYSFPFVVIIILLGHENLFFYLICFSLFTDFLDGWIARRFNQASVIGATLDSLADTFLYFQAVIGLVFFKWQDFRPYLMIIIIFLVLLILADLYPWLKFGKFNNYHTYASKGGGYIKGLFFIFLFAVGFNRFFFYIVMITSIIGFVESLVITLILKESRSDVKGLYWILKK